MSVSYAQTLLDKPLQCGTVYVEAKMKKSFIERLQELIRSSMHHHWSQNKSSVTNEPAQFADLILILQAD